MGLRGAVLRGNVVPAAGYTISRYVKFSVVSSNHRHPCVPRPVVVGGRKEFCSRAIPGPGPSQNSALSGTPAPKVQGTYAVRGVPGFSLAFSHIRSAGILPPPAAPLLGRSVIKSRVSGKASHTAFAASAPR